MIFHNAEKGIVVHDPAFGAGVVVSKSDKLEVKFTKGEESVCIFYSLDGVREGCWQKTLYYGVNGYRSAPLDRELQVFGNFDWKDYPGKRHVIREGYSIIVADREPLIVDGELELQGDYDVICKVMGHWELTMINFPDIPPKKWFAGPVFPSSVYSNKWITVDKNGTVVWNHSQPFVQNDIWVSDSKVAVQIYKPATPIEHPNWNTTIIKRIEQIPKEWLR